MYRTKHLFSVVLSAVVLCLGLPVESDAKPEPKTKQRAIESTPDERLERLTSLVEQFKDLRKTADKAWNREMESNRKLRETNEGFWSMHYQRKAIDARCSEIEYRIRKLKSSKQSKKKEK